MGYACYQRNGRDQGYGVPAICDHPDCNEKIDLGMGYACGGDPMENCGLFFCNNHLSYYKIDEIWVGPICERCAEESAQPFDPKPNTPEWRRHKMNHISWEDWRANNPSFCFENADLVNRKTKR